MAGRHTAGRRGGAGGNAVCRAASEDNAVGSCCAPGDIDDVFSATQAESKARRFRERGLDGEAREILRLLRGDALPGTTVLEVGGGIGALAIELVRAGADHATNVELATSYEPAAASLIADAGLEGRIERRVADFVTDADAIPMADAVILERVVCCYPDDVPLVRAAAGHAARRLVLTFPVERWWIGLGLAAANTLLRLRGSKFRGFMHPASRIIASAEAEGLRLTYRRKGLLWQLLVFARA
jgi:O-methyltransferase domain